MPSELLNHGRQFPGLFRSPAEWESDPTVRFYHHHLQRASEAFDLAAVFCVGGKPTIYFTKVDGPNANREAKWQRLLWNQDTASMLVVEDATRTRIYSALAHPSDKPAFAGDARLAEDLETAALALEFRQFLLSVQTGQFYRDHVNHFRTDAAVDQYLLANLTEARRLLISEDHDDRLPPEMANAFLARSLFTTYLIERDVIGKAQLEKIQAPVGATLRKVLEGSSDSDAIKSLFRLFRLLDDDFNGSMFGGTPFSAEQTRIRARHLSVLRRLLRGDDLRTDQQVLFDLYNFHYIPIELISAIYENFIVGRSQNDMDGPESQQRRGAYYTPPRLAELVVDIATEGWDTLLDKQYLDPACGSGVFLVILFQRMAAEWRRRNPQAGNVERARKLRQILTENLCGIDVDPTACMVACFSLYLAFLDQLEPRDIWGLKDVLATEGEQKVLPPLQGVPTTAQGICPVILESNFFRKDVDGVGPFDLVIGNPPWTGRNQPADPEAEAWLLGDDPPRNPHLKDGPRQKQARVARFFPQKQSAIGYMWKVPRHLKPNGIACLLLPSRVILANTTDAFQAAWFRRFTVEAIWQLADYRFILFKEAVCPAIVATFRSAKPDSDHGVIEYCTPKVERVDPRYATITVSPDDRKTLHLSNLLSAANDDCAYMFWKMPVWGTDRDRRLLDRLRTLRKLGDQAGEPDETKRWVKGQGFKPWYKESYEADPKKYGEPKPRWWNDSALFLDATSREWALILVDRDCAMIGAEPNKLHRLPDERVFKSPMVLVNQGCTRFAFSDFDVLFQHSLQSIAGPSSDEDLLLFLTGLFNSPLAKYYLFHTSANWGIERDKVHFEELLQLPFPLPEETDNPGFSRRIIRKVAARLRRAGKEMALVDALSKTRREEARDSAIRDVSELVYQFFGLSSWERSLVEDTVAIFEPSSTPASLESDIETLKPSMLEERKAYAELLCRTINRWASRADYFLVPSFVIAAKEGLGMLTLTKRAKGEPAQTYREQAATKQMGTLIERVTAASVDVKTGGLRYLRGFALFEEREVHILKPLSRYHWTRTAALNDADEFAGFIANMGQEA